MNWIHMSSNKKKGLFHFFWHFSKNTVFSCKSKTNKKNTTKRTQNNLKLFKEQSKQRSVEKNSLTVSYKQFLVKNLGNAAADIANFYYKYIINIYKHAYFDTFFKINLRLCDTTN